MTLTSSPQPKIEMQNVAKAFGDNQVLRDVSLSVAAEESLAIIGTSGCGKSVTLKCLLGLLRADSGSIRVEGQELIHATRADFESVRRRFGMTFQFGALFDSLPIWENVTFRLRQRQRLSKTESRDIAAETITQLGLAAHVIDQYPAELSGGMQKRVALARAIADKPEVLLFDEPTSGLDPITGGVIDRLIIDSVRRLGATAITISHDMASVRRIADKVAMVHNGTIIWCGPASEMDDTGIAEVDQFVHGHADGPLTRSHSHSRIPLPRRRACRPGSPSLIALQAADLCVALQRSLAATRVLANRHCCYSLSASWPPADTGPPISPERNQPIRCACGRAGWGLVMHRSIWRPPPMPVMLPHRWVGRLVRRSW